VSSIETLPEVRTQVQASTSANPQALEIASHALDIAEQQARQEAQTAGQLVSNAVRQSYATSITRIYFYAIWLTGAALLAIALWLPEIPLRKSNRMEAPPALE